MLNAAKNLIKSLVGNQDYTISGTELTGKVVVVTGASRGIGQSICKVLEAHGAKVIKIARHFPQKDTSTFEADLTKLAEAEKVFTKIESTFGRFDILVNNVGKYYESQITEITSETLESCLAINIAATVFCTKLAARIMKKSGTGLIINIGSRISHNNNVSQGKSFYALSKHAVEGFSIAANNELAKFGIRVVCIMPGNVNTFISLNSKNKLSKHDIGKLIIFIATHPSMDFSPIAVKHVKNSL
jgi:3-oxoacyl-[acyl-carrier protein] reductase